MKRNKPIVVRTSLTSCIFMIICSMIFFYFAFIEAVPSLVIPGIFYLIITFLLYQDKYIIYTNEVNSGSFSIKIDKKITNTFSISSTTYQVNHPFIIISDGCNAFIGIKRNKLVRELKKLGIKEEELA